MKNLAYRYRSLLTGFTLCGLAVQALALPPPPYAVVDIGHSAIGLKTADGGAAGVQTLDGDRRDTGYGITLGWRFSEHLAVEGAFLELGQSRYDVAVQNGGSVSNATFKVGSTGVLLAMAGTWPLHEKWWLEGRAGAYIGKTETRVSGVNSGPLGGQAFDNLLGSKTKIGFAAGVGAVTAFNETWGMRVGYDYLDQAFGKNAGRISVGVRYTWP